MLHFIVPAFKLSCQKKILVTYACCMYACEGEISFNAYRQSDKLFSNFEYCVILFVHIWLNEFKTTENLFQFYLLLKHSLYEM